ncbi:MAG: hypothetical protein J0L66_06810 [Cytophagales bacterium]|nr:hypothetical protein [Cytophagales bacterium]
MIRLLIISFCLGVQAVSAQSDFSLLKTWKAKGTELISVDRLGNFLLIDKAGRIVRYNEEGKKIAASPRQVATLVEPWFQPTVFVYNRKNQTYTLWDRNFETRTAYAVDAAWAIEPWLVCPTHDNRLWLLDKADWSLKKIMPGTGQVIQEFTLNLPDSNVEFIYMREYLNFVFLLDIKNGVSIYNHLGTRIEQLAAPNLKGIYFFGDEFYILQHGTLRYFNLLTSQWREHAVPANTAQAIITDERLLTLSSNNVVSLYKYTPE